MFERHLRVLILHNEQHSLVSHSPYSRKLPTFSRTSSFRKFVRVTKTLAITLVWWIWHSLVPKLKILMIDAAPMLMKAALLWIPGASIMISRSGAISVYSRLCSMQNILESYNMTLQVNTTICVISN